jgi:reactive intermediate/imine deaminase
MTDKLAVTTADAPAPAHTFSQGVRKGPFVQVSGQGPVDPATNEYLYPGDVGAQTTRTLQNVKAIVDASGASFDDVVMLRVYLTKREDFAAMNDAYGEFVSANTSGAVLPCRTTVFTGLPRAEMLVEIDAIAVAG